MNQSVTQRPRHGCHLEFPVFFRRFRISSQGSLFNGFRPCGLSQISVPIYSLPLSGAHLGILAHPSHHDPVDAQTECIYLTNGWRTVVGFLMAMRCTFLCRPRTFVKNPTIIPEASILFLVFSLSKRPLRALQRGGSQKLVLLYVVHLDPASFSGRIRSASPLPRLCSLNYTVTHHRLFLIH